jgi:Fic/DOC family
MATPQEKLAQALEELQKLQNEKGIAVIQASEMTRTIKDRLVANGFIKEVVKGWYISTRPDEIDGDTTSWYMSFWYFVSVYCKNRFGDDWCLSPEQSLMLHAGNYTVPKQLLVRSSKASNNNLDLPHNTSIFDTNLSVPDKENKTVVEGVNLYSLEAGLISVGEDYFTHRGTDARTCIAMVKDGSILLGKLLDGGHSAIAGRLAGAFRNNGNDKIADTIVKTMKSAGYDIRETDPFKEKLPNILNARETSPYANRIKIMWYKMREIVIVNFPSSKELPIDIDAYLKEVEENYADDAYNSLSIEGYRVTAELIERVRDGKWDPEVSEADKKEKNAMAARGYYQAFQAVKVSIKTILGGANAGKVADNDHGDWYRELFAPSVTAGIIKASDLAGYRNGQVFIKGSKHTPLSPEAVRDAMPVFFDLLKEEKEPSVRAVLGHFIFVYIHPYIDGNGRIGRFLFNTMLASGGYSWTIVPVEKRDDYMAALEKASVDGNIKDFAKFLGELVKKTSK